MKKVRLEVGWRLYSLIVGFIVVALTLGIVYAAFVPADQYHESTEVKVTINGADHSLQDAIDDGLLGGTKNIFHKCNNDGTAVIGTDEACANAQLDGGLGTERAGLGNGRYRAISCDINLVNAEFMSTLEYEDSIWKGRIGEHGNLPCDEGTIIVIDLNALY